MERDEQVIAQALAAGWSYQPVSLYDEEGVEGFRWDGPGGEELVSFAVGGDWRNGPEVPDQLRLLFDPEAQQEAAERKAEAERRAEFFRWLLGSAGETSRDSEGSNEGPASGQG